MFFFRKLLEKVLCQKKEQTKKEKNIARGWDRLGAGQNQPNVHFFLRVTEYYSYADDTTLMVDSEEELKSLLMKVKEESGKVGLKLNI